MLLWWRVLMQWNWTSRNRKNATIANMFENWMWRRGNDNTCYAPMCVSKIDWTWYFTNCVLFFTIVEGKKTWGTRHTILLRNVGRRNNVRLVPIKKKTLSYRRIKEIVNSLHTTCAQEKKSPNMRWFLRQMPQSSSHKINENDSHTVSDSSSVSSLINGWCKQTRRTDNKFLTRNDEPSVPLYWWDHVSKHWWDSPSLCEEIAANAKTSVRWKRHPRHTTHQPQHQQFGSHNTWIWTKVQNPTMTQDASREDASWINNTQHKNKVITQSHNTTLLFATCPATSSAKQRVLTKSGSHGILGSVLTWLANFLQQWAINNRPTSTTSQHHKLHNAS